MVIQEAGLKIRLITTLAGRVYLIQLMSLRAGATTQLHLGNLSDIATVWNHFLSYLQTYFDNDKATRASVTTSGATVTSATVK